MALPERVDDMVYMFEYKAKAKVA